MKSFIVFRFCLESCIFVGKLNRNYKRDKLIKTETKHYTQMDLQRRNIQPNTMDINITNESKLMRNKPKWEKDLNN